MKKLLFILLATLFIFADSFLEPSEAFKTNFIKNDSNYTINLTLGKDIYVYDEQLKIKVNGQDITTKLNIRKPIAHHDTFVHFNELNIIIEKSLLNQLGINEVKSVDFDFQGCSELGICYQPMSESWSVEAKRTETTQPKQELNETDAISKTLQEGNLWIILVTFFGFGLLLSLTPCVFPMIPILSSIIVNASKTESGMSASRGFFLSLVYVLSMALAYTIAGIVAGIFGANLQVALQNPYVLSAFAFIFVALAFSMFGYFTIELPQSLQNKINKTTDGKEKQGVLGVAIMGFLSALIVGPCVAPPLAGALVYIGQTGDAFLGGAALFVMSIGMGMPLLLIGLGAGKFMPKPSGWMERVTQTFGVIMLAVAVWMLDRVLPAEVTMMLWALLLIGSAVYMGVFETMPHDIPSEYRMFRIVAVIFLIYGAMIFVGAVNGATNPLKPLEDLFKPKGVVTTVSASKESMFVKVKNVTELEKAIAESSKPIMLDFYADWCVSCKEMEHNTFSNPDVQKKLSEFTLLQADVTNNTAEDKEMLKMFNLFGPPGIIFWDKEKNEIRIARVVGYKDPEIFLKHLNKFF